MTTAPGGYGLQETINTLLKCGFDQEAGGVNIVNNVAKSRHPVGHPEDMWMARSLALREQFSVACRELYQEAYPLLQQDHERRVADAATEASALFQSSPGLFKFRLHPSQVSVEPLTGIDFTTYSEKPYREAALYLQYGDKLPAPGRIRGLLCFPELFPKAIADEVVPHLAKIAAEQEEA